MTSLLSLFTWKTLLPTAQSHASVSSENVEEFDLELGETRIGANQSIRFICLNSLIVSSIDINRTDHCSRNHALRKWNVPVVVPLLRVLTPARVDGQNKSLRRRRGERCQGESSSSLWRIIGLSHAMMALCTTTQLWLSIDYCEWRRGWKPGAR